MRQRELKLTIDEAAKSELEQHLRLTAPVNIIISEKNQTTLHGAYMPFTRTITLEINMERFQLSGLVAIKREIVKTILHEYRHAYQEDHWDPEKIARDMRRDYRDRRIEIDAREWADQNSTKWLRIAKLQPKRTHSKLRGLAAAERKVR